jgi:hypothetical protein
MSKDIILNYLEFEILWHTDIMNSSSSLEDRKWKQGQIDLLKRMLDEVMGIERENLLTKLLKDFDYAVI